MEAQLLVVALGVLALGVMVCFGWARGGSLRDAPRRETGLVLMDLAVALVIQAVGMVVLSAVLNAGGGRSAPPVAASRPGVSAPDAPATAPAPGSPPAVPTPASLPAPSTSPAAPLTTRQAATRALLGQALGQLPMVLYVVARLGGWRRGREFGLIPRRPGREALTAAVALLLTLPLVVGTLCATALIAELLRQPPPPVAHEMLRAIQAAHGGAGRAALILSAVVVAPLLEEIIFRGLVQTALLELDFLRARRAGVVLLAAGFFTLMHVGLPWQTWPGLFVLALVLGWLYERTGSLWPGIIVHTGFNACNVVMVSLMSPR